MFPAPIEPGILVVVATQTSGNAVILLVEDDRDTQESMKCALEMAGYDVTVASGADEAMNRLRRGLQPRVIMLDLMMPGKTGFQFRGEQMQDPRFADIPLVVYSGHHDIIANAVQLGAAAYFQKPVDIDALLHVIEKHCPKPPPDRS